MRGFHLLVLSMLALVQGQLLQNGEKEWELFKIRYYKEYPSKDEKNLRKEIFLKSLQRVTEHNERYNKGEVTFTTGINKYSDRSYEEIASSRKGYRSLPKDELVNVTVYSPRPGMSSSRSIDWRSRGAVTPVKDQLDCSSSWAFSAVGSLESQQFLKTKHLFSLSEQNLVDCADQLSYGCNGGSFLGAFVYVLLNDGIDLEETYTYRGEEGECHFNSLTAGAKIKTFMRIASKDETSLQLIVGTKGPVSAAIDASGVGFHDYKEGLYTNLNCSQTELNHAVLVVGYGTTSDGQDYWLVKNSWGTDWGMGGYMMMARNQNNMCGIATDVFFVVV